VATSLAYLAALYKSQGHYTEADGPEHPHIATSLESYAALLRQTERGDVAARMLARAKTIRAKSE
jgi:hypothetical protein